MTKVIYSDDHTTIVKLLKRARLEAGLDQVEAAEKIGKTQSYISKLESGQRHINVLQLKEFSRIYKKPFNYFIQ